MNTYLICDSSHWRSARWPAAKASLRYRSPPMCEQQPYTVWVSWCEHILNLEPKLRLSTGSNKQTLTNRTSVKPRDGMNDTALLVHQRFDLFLPWSKEKLKLTLGHERRGKFSMAIFHNTKIFFTFMLITVNRGMGMLITVICYFSTYLVVVKCAKDPTQVDYIKAWFFTNSSEF